MSVSEALQKTPLSAVATEDIIIDVLKKNNAEGILNLLTDCSSQLVGKIAADKEYL